MSASQAGPPSPVQTPVLRAVVSGASIAGLSAAYWLRRIGWHVTMIERAEEFRTGGQNVDVRGVAREVLERMGLVETVRGEHTTETGTVIVGDSGEIIGELSTDTDDADGATAELEILRGDFAGILLEALPKGVDFVWGDYIVAANTSDALNGGVVIRTAGGEELEADLLVIAEGVRSSTRKLVFGEDSSALHELDVAMVFGTIPRTPDDDSTWRWYNAVGGRQVHLRPDNHGTTRAILAFSPIDEDLINIDHDEAMQALRRRYASAGWQAPRVLDGFDASDDVYVDQLAQVKMSTWHRGRVVLAGDAGWCVTPMGGGGASLALVSGYVLAAYLSRQPLNVREALGDYETWMRPLVDEAQDFPTRLTRVAYPRTRVGLALRHLVDRAITSAPLRPLATKLTQVADTDQTLPDLYANSAPVATP